MDCTSYSQMRQQRLGTLDVTVDLHCHGDGSILGRYVAEGQRSTLFSVEVESCTSESYISANSSINMYSVLSADNSTYSTAHAMVTQVHPISNTRGDDSQVAPGYS